MNTTKALQASREARTRLEQEDTLALPRLVLKPQAGPQEDFMSRVEDEVLYGGSKGGGKTYALLLESLRQVENPSYRGIIFRRTFPKLSEIIDRSQQFFPALGARYKSDTHTWKFPSGAIIRFAHCQTEADKYVYQGHEYHFMGFDQLEEFTESMYLFLIAQNRTSVKGILCYVRATANPGNIGHAWVYRRFMTDPVTGNEIMPKTVISDTFKIESIAGLEDIGNVTRSRVFIPATVYDNIRLLEANPSYLANLMQLPDRERRALLEGDWHVFVGQYFPEFRRARHIVRPFEIPAHWPRFRCMDYGSSAPFACFWGAVDEEGNVWFYREFYMSGLNARESARRIVELSGEEKYVFSVIDPSVFSTTGQNTLETELWEGGLQYLEAGANDRLAGWQKFREYLRPPKVDDLGVEEKKPSVFFFDNCRSAIRTIPALVHDDHKVEDCNTKGEDHAPDAIRYGLMRLRDEKAVPPGVELPTWFGVKKDKLKKYANPYGFILP